MSETLQLQVYTTEAGLARILAADTQGLKLRLTHVGLGDGAYDPAKAPGRRRTALKHEVVRVPIAASRNNPTTRQLDISAIAQGAEEFWVREVGFFDEAGTLVFFWSDATRPLGYKSAPSRFLLGLSLVITEVPIGAIQVIDQGQPLNLAIGPIEADLKGEHPEGKTHHFPLTNMIETDWLAESSQFEYLAEILRGMGQSGVFSSRQYGAAGTEAFNRTFDGAYAAINLHNHPNFLATGGLGEIAVMINGYYLRTRHNDYRLRSPVAGKYLATQDVPPPPVPDSVARASSVAASVEEMREYFRAFAARDITLRDYREHFRWNLAVLEIWPELLTGAVDDTFESFRHTEEIADYRKLLNRTLLLDATGHSTRYENGSFIPGSIRLVSSTGRPQYVAWRYRITTTDVGSVGDYPMDELITPLDLPIQRWDTNRTSQQIARTRRQRWRINRSLSADPHWGQYNEAPTVDLLDELMGKVAGLDGAGTVLAEEYQDSGLVTRLTQWNSQEPLNAACYNRRYGNAVNASGRTRNLRSYNDPTLFVAANTRPEVAAFTEGEFSYRRSYAIPLELILRTPLEGWNPYAIKPATKLQGDGLSPESAYNGSHTNGRYYLTPAELFTDNVANPDPADTGATPRWIKDGGGTPRLVRASGLYAELPRTFQGSDLLRLRYPVYPLYHEGGWAAAAVEALAGDYGINLAQLLRGHMAQQAEIDTLSKSLRHLQGELTQLKLKR
ncbi:phage tail protein [Pseudomonas sp. TCU-HL1]|uniref:phage tail-collar fiber domain-containing protein n=1 Tax=Pseudomonas sp. TCU-HL1 TaxID=1856685 RepID=UPI00083D15E7|nr:phage tail protein [Pseudomonas sp. TCU-HL1]AOE85832.1 hypothetical protein THL1_3284 [Pseudomonas sp. TCU-HL1]